MSDGECAKNRYAMGADILLSMESNDDLPQPNVHRLSKAMQEYYKDGGYDEVLEEQQSKWRGSAGYWRRHTAEIADASAKRKKKYFAYIVKPGDSLKEGSWRFCTRAEYEAYLRQEHVGIGTRVDHHHEKLEDAQVKWKTELPALTEVPLLTN